MFNIFKTAADSYHIYEGDCNASMLYRYNILLHDDGTAADATCTQGEDFVSFEAGKRKLSVSIERNAKGYCIKIPLSKKERLFGIGDATRKSVMIRGIRAYMSVSNVNSYGPMPVLISSDGWGFLLNTTYSSFFDCAYTDADTLIVEVDEKRVDFYLFRADTLKETIGKITAVTGRPIMLPKFAYGLTFVENEEINTRGLLWDIKTLRDRGIACDVIGLEPNWMETHYDYSTENKWNTKDFPLPSWQPENTSSNFTLFYPMRQMGMQLSLWQCCNYDLFFYEDDNLKTEAKKEFSDDAVIQDAHFENDVKTDLITKKNEPWFEHLKKFIDNGAAALKCDGATQVMFHNDRLWGEKYLDAEAHNIYPVLLSKQLQNGFRDYTGRRLLLYTAGAFTGTQRYAATWAGDTGGGFGTLTSIMNYAMCGHSNAACDIDVDSPEAIHYGFFTPWSQYFCWANWRYPWFLTPEKEEMIRFYSNLRSSLVPYIYTMAHKAYATGISVLRPLALEYEDTDRFDEVKNEYMFGDNLLIGAFDMDLTLPDGKWIDYATGEVYEGDVAYEIPKGMGGAVLVREGSVFVTMQPQKYILEKEHDYIINVYPGADTEFSLYEDDGFTFDYEQGIFAETLIQMTDSADSGFTLTVCKRTGDFPGRPDNGHDIETNSIPEIKGIQPVSDMTVKINGTKPTSITLNGAPVAFDYDGRFAELVLPAAVHNDGDAVFKVQY